MRFKTRFRPPQRVTGNSDWEGWGWSVKALNPQWILSGAAHSCQVLSRFLHSPQHCSVAFLNLTSFVDCVISGRKSKLNFFITSDDFFQINTHRSQGNDWHYRVQNFVQVLRTFITQCLYDACLLKILIFPRVYLRSCPTPPWWGRSRGR